VPISPLLAEMGTYAARALEPPLSKRTEANFRSDFLLLQPEMPKPKLEFEIPR